MTSTSGPATATTITQIPNWRIKAPLMLILAIVIMAVLVTLMAFQLMVFVELWYYSIFNQEIMKI
jgi:hypothetical protein